MTSINTSLASSGYLLSLFGASSTTSTPTMSALAGYQPYVANETRKVSTYSQQSTTQQAVSYFEANISKVKSVTQLTQDPKLLNFITTAFGLSADAQYPAKVAAVLNSNLSDQTSYANSLIDPRYQQFAKEFNVASSGMANFSSSSVISDVVNRYLTNSYETSLDSVNPALHNAAYFLRTVGSITSAYSILGDPALRNVFETTQNIPVTIANLPVADQANLINSAVNLKQFETTGSSSSTGTATSSTAAALATAQSELSTLSGTTAIVTAAQTQVQSVVNQIQAIQQGYTNLATIQNPSGQFAAEIPVQEAAAPGLVEQKGLLTAAQTATGTVTSDISQLQTLLRQVGSPSNTTAISALQAEFTTLTTQITGAISGASYQFDNGTGGTSYTSQNLLDGSMSSPVTVTYDAKGDATTVNAQNLGTTSSFQAQLSAANAAFQAISGAGDGANIQAAATALSGAQTTASVVTQSVANDANNFQTAIAAVPQWAGTYNSAQLYQGSQAVADAGSRVTQVNQLLSQIQTLAAQSNQLAAGSDRSSLETQYQTLIGQLGQAIGQTTNPNVDNLLQANPGATPGYYSYGIDPAGTYTIQARTSDLSSGVLAPLQNLDISSAADASAVITTLTGNVQTLMASTSQQIATDSQTFSLAANTIDPRAAVDNQYRQLATSMTNVVSSAANNGQNLLVSTQAPITVTASSAGQQITLNPENFDSTVTQVLTAGSQLLPSTAADTTGALAQLANASFGANNILDNLNGDLNQVQYATRFTNATISTLKKQQTQQSSTSAGLPVNDTSFAVQFVQKYLATVDAQNAAAGTGGNSYVTQLFTPTQTLDQTIGNLLTSTGSVNLTV